METATATPETAPVAKPKKKAKAKPGTSKAKQNKAKRAPKDETKLRKAQVRILKCLARNSAPLTKQKICDKIAKEYPTAAKFQGWMSSALGTFDEAASKAMEKRLGFPSLMTLKMVKATVLDIDGVKETVYEITDKGRKAVAKPE